MYNSFFVLTKKTLLIAILWLLVGGVANVTAYETYKSNGKPIVWTNMPIQWELNPGGFNKIPFNELEQVFQRAFNTWQIIQCSSATFAYRGQSKLFQDYNDKKNVISFPPNFVQKYGNIVLVTAHRHDNKGGFVDFDIEINPQIAWSTKPNSSEQDLESLAMVVAGHLLGLASSNVSGATMHGIFMTGDISKRTLHPDDVAGACFLYSSGQPQCAQDTDCPPGLGCQATQCIQKPPPADSTICKVCASDNDCGANMTCDLLNNSTYCIQYCNPDGLCPKDYACSGNGIGAQCLPLNGVCPATSCKANGDCPSGHQCVNNICQPQCKSNSDCPAANPQCIRGQCVPNGYCFQDHDCPLGQKCENNQCKQSNEPCQKDDDCPPNYRCIQGKCTVTLPCNSDRDCPAGYICQNRQCVQSPKQCQPNDKQTCTCKDGSQGLQLCDANGQWGTCQCQGSACTPGATQACTCVGGGQGSQTCASDGQSWGTCQCQGSACTPGATQACTCVGGGQGSQTCASDGKSWGTCQCQGATCTPGATQACTCAGGGKGSQTCSPNGSWGACECGSSGVCTPGATQACVCVDGGQGSQSCAADGKSWGSCQCSQARICAPGATQACVCSDGRSGSQLCSQDGTRWDVCQCTGSVPNPDGGANNPGECQTHGQCPANQVCHQGRCTSSIPNQGGCNCHIPITPSQPMLLIIILALGLILRRIKVRPTI